MVLTRLAEQLLEAELADRGLEPGVDRALGHARDLVLGIARRGHPIGRRGERLKHLGDGDVGGRTRELVAAARSAFADDEARLAKLTNDFF